MLGYDEAMIVFSTVLVLLDLVLFIGLGVATAVESSSAGCAREIEWVSFYVAAISRVVLSVICCILFIRWCISICTRSREHQM